VLALLPVAGPAPAAQKLEEVLGGKSPRQRQRHREQGGQSCADSIHVRSFRSARQGLQTLVDRALVRKQAPGDPARGPSLWRCEPV